MLVRAVASTDMTGPRADTLTLSWANEARPEWMGGEGEEVA